MIWQAENEFLKKRIATLVLGLRLPMQNNL